MGDEQVVIGALLSGIAARCSGKQAWDLVAALHATDRWSSFDRYAETATFCAEQFRSFGLQVEHVAFPADGRTKYGDWRMPLAWDAVSARLSDVATSCVLADYCATPQSLAMWSAPTPPEGVSGELVCLERRTVEELGERGVRGKILLTPRHPTEIKAAAAERGALGILTHWTKGGTQPDVRQWINTWSDAPGGWAMHSGDRRLWGFTLTPREGSALRERSATSRTPLRLHAQVATRLYEGDLHWVTGAIPGETDEEVLLMAHINEQGGNDNAAGAATLLEVARMLTGLIARGDLPRPRRTIRFLLMPESYGTMAYAAQNRERLARTRVALNVDSGAGAFGHEDSVLDVYANPHCCPNDWDAVLVGIVRAYYAGEGRPENWRLKRYTLAGDNCFCDPQLGVPHPWLAMGDGGDLWHNSADTPDRVDPRSLADLCRVVGAFAAYAGRATRDEVRGYAVESRESLPPDAQAILRSAEEPPVPAAFPGSERVPERDLFGALTLDGIPPADWGCIGSSPRWWGPHLAAWWWIDGSRSLGEIAARIEREFGTRPADLLAYVDQLATLGYVRFRTP